MNQLGRDRNVYSGQGERRHDRQDRCWVPWLQTLDIWCLLYMWRKLVLRQ